MPLSIIKHNIAEVECDAIVSTTNRNLYPNGSIDVAIHEAAGEELYDACQRIGWLDVGEAQLTAAYDLPCRVVIHTVGPWWEGGERGEREYLRSCYRECLKLAKATKSESIAIPLIASGARGCPKDEVLTIALSEIKAFLYEYDMQVYLVLYDKEEYTLNPELTRELSAYIEEEYDGMDEDEPSFAEMKCMRISQRMRHCRRFEEEADAVGRVEDLLEFGQLPCHNQSVPSFDEENILRNLYDGFALTLMKLIDEKGIDDVECYKKANVSRQTWYKILNDASYKPNKKTIISFAIALELGIEDTQKLLATAGFILSKSSKFDLIIMYCIVKGIYDVFEIESILFQYDQEMLFSK